MADNFITNSASGGSTFAADDISSVFYPRVKPSWGVDGSAVDVSATNPLPTELVSTGGTGASIFRSIDLDESEEEVKATAGAVYWVRMTNRATAERFVKFYNATAASVTVGTTTPVLTIPMAALSSETWTIPQGLRFTTAICAAATTGVADSDTGAPAANDVVINIGYV